MSTNYVVNDFGRDTRNVELYILYKENCKKETGSIEQGSENAEYEGRVFSVLAPFCFEEALVQRE